jgi:hypothetical protein
LDEAGSKHRVCAIARFTFPELRHSLEADGIQTLTCDLLDPSQVAALPDFKSILFLAGMKFGSSARPDLTWAANTIVPVNVARRYSQARIVVFSTSIRSSTQPLEDPPRRILAILSASTRNRAWVGSASSNIFRQRAERVAFSSGSSTRRTFGTGCLSTSRAKSTRVTPSTCAWGM